MENTCKIDGQIEEAKNLLARTEGSAEFIKNRIKELEAEKKKIENPEEIFLARKLEEYGYKYGSIDSTSKNGQKEITVTITGGLPFSGDAFLENFYKTYGFYLIQCLGSSTNESTYLRFHNK